MRLSLIAILLLASLFLFPVANRVANAADKAEVSEARHGVIASDRGHVVKFDAQGNVVNQIKVDDQVKKGSLTALNRMLQLTGTGTLNVHQDSAQPA